MLKKPNEIAVALREAGRKKTQLSLDRMFVLGILAGVYIGFGAQLATTVSMDLAPKVGVGLSNMISGGVFSVGLMLVVLGGAELFTGNNLIWISFLSRRSKVTAVLRNWATVFLGNFVGSMLLAILIFVGGFYTMGGNALGIRALTIANGKVNIGFIQLIARGIVCNWLVCLAVWIATSAEDTTGKILACFFPIMAFVASGFEHSIANMFFIPIGILLKGVPNLVSQAGLNLEHLTWTGFLSRNLLPVTIGNIIGGGFFVATLYWYVYLRPEARALDMIAELNPVANENQRVRILSWPRSRELTE
jgi:formate/nitrite transporter